MWVLSVAQRPGLRDVGSASGGAVIAPPSTSTAIIVMAIVASYCTGVGERLLHEPEPELQRRSAGARQLLEHARVVRRIDDHQHVAEVLRRRAHQARTADIDLFDQVVERRSRDSAAALANG